MYHKRPIKPYRCIDLTAGRGVIFSRLSDGTIVAISGQRDRWGIIIPQRTRTRRAWAIGERV